MHGLLSLSVMCDASETHVSVMCDPSGKCDAGGVLREIEI
jgi:hypothetical protein